MNSTPIIKRFWNWTDDEGTDERTLYLNGVIAEESWFADEVTPEAFKNELFAETGPIILHINSPGGDCIAASQIYTMLMDYPFDVHVQIDGIAASAASVIAMAGTKVSMSPTSLMMVHNPWTTACGDTSDMTKAIALLKEVKESIINAYEIKTGLSRQQISGIMDNETWMNANRAKELGFCDEVLYSENEADSTSFGFSSKAAELHLMNLLRDSVSDGPETKEAGSHDTPDPKAEALTNSIPSASVHANTITSGEIASADLFTTAVYIPPDDLDSAIEQSLIQEGIPLPENSLAAFSSVPVSPGRVKVTQIDARLEHLKY